MQQLLTSLLIQFKAAVAAEAVQSRLAVASGQSRCCFRRVLAVAAAAAACTAVAQQRRTFQMMAHCLISLFLRQGYVVMASAV